MVHAEFISVVQYLNKVFIDKDTLGGSTPCFSDLSRGVFLLHTRKPHLANLTTIFSDKTNESMILNSEGYRDK